MSWNTYIENLQAKGFEDAAIVSVEDGSTWAKSPDMEIDGQIVQQLKSGFTNKDVLCNGLRLKSEKFIYLQSDDSQMQFKKGKCGICIAKANKVILIGTYKDPTNGGQARSALEGVRDYLKENGY